MQRGGMGVQILVCAETVPAPVRTGGILLLWSPFTPQSRALFADGEPPGGLVPVPIRSALIREQGEQEKGFVLRPPLRCRGRVGPLDRLAGILALRPRRGGKLRPQRALPFADDVLRLSPQPVPGQELLRAGVFAGQTRDRPEMARELLPLRTDHDKGHAPLQLPAWNSCSSGPCEFRRAPGPPACPDAVPPSGSVPDGSGHGPDTGYSGNQTHPASARRESPHPCEPAPGVRPPLRASPPQSAARN